MPLGALASLGAGAMSAISNYFTNQRTNDTNIALQESANAANRQLAAEQRQWDLEMWYRQNAYNDPSAQMARLKAAGINPALAYADGNMMNEAAPAQAAAGSRDAAARVQGYYMDPLMMAQIANINAQTEKTKTETDVQQSKLPLELQQMRVDIAATNQSIQESVAKVASLNADQKLTLSKTLTEDVHRSIMQGEFGLKQQEVAMSLKEAQSRIDLNRASEAVQYSIQHLNDQKFEYLMQANALTLAGLEWDNQLKAELSQLRIDQHNINELNETLLGFKVNEGAIEDVWNQERLKGARGEYGKLEKLAQGAVSTLRHAGQTLRSFSPFVK